MRTLEVAGQQVPVLGLGTLGRTGDDGRAIVEAALAEGYRHVDTAQFYGSEEAVGQALARSGVPRSDVWLTTKLVHPRGPVVEDFGEAMADSLRRLGTDDVDLTLLHWPRPDRDLEADLAGLVSLRDRGLTRAIGVSNYPPTLLSRALELVPDLAFDQVEFHVFLGGAPLLDLLRARGMVLTAYCPLARGAVFDEPVIHEVAEGHGCTPAQVALAWVLAQDRVVAVPGADTVDQVRDNVGALDVALSTDELAILDGLEQGRRVVSPPFGPDWDAG